MFDDKAIPGADPFPADHPAPSLRAAVVAECLSPTVLLRVQAPSTSLALWRRAGTPSLRRVASVLAAQGSFCLVAEGTPAAASRTLLRGVGAAGRGLTDDCAMLGRLFATVTGCSTVRFRLECLADNACCRPHVDAVRLRLLCTYAGLGTEWTDPAGRTKRMRPLQVGIFKGSAFADLAPRILHRSPPVEHLPPSRRSRLLLCIDEPGTF